MSKYASGQLLHVANFIEKKKKDGREPPPRPPPPPIGTSGLIIIVMFCSITENAILNGNWSQWNYTR